MILSFDIENQRLRSSADDVYVEGSVEYLQAEFTLSEDWADHVVTVFFQHEGDDAPTALILPDTLECTVPSNVLRAGQIYIWARGDLASSVITTNQVILTVYATGAINIDPDPNDDVYGQILGMAQEAQQSAENAAEDAERAANYAQQVATQTNNAAASAQLAGTYASQASQSATSASQSAEGASASAQQAKEYADTVAAQAKDVADDVEQIGLYADSAKESAAAAAHSAVSAAKSAEAAVLAATEAAEHADGASQSAKDAQQSVADSEGSASAAAASSQSAAASAQLALQHSNDADSYAQAAQKASSDAADFASAAQQAQVGAEGARDAAHLSASSAGTSATQAHQSAEDAASSAQSATQSAANALQFAQQAEQAVTGAKQDIDDATASAVQTVQATGATQVSNVQASGSAQQTLIAQSGQSALNTIATEREASVSAVEGEGTKQVSAVAGAATMALESIGQTEQAAIQQVQQAGTTQTQAVNAAGDSKLGAINEANAHAPNINAVTGKWRVWDPDTNAYVDTTTNAQGPIGATGANGQDGVDGQDGATFTPTVDVNGDISWTNDKSLPNPATMNIRGPQGVAGEAATIEVGTVSASAPGSLPAINNSGTATAARFDFVLPRGDVGPTGAAGADGATWYVGTEAPSDSAQGTDGDFYYQSSTWTIYHKENGAWVDIGTNKGADGQDGAPGPQGPAGLGVPTPSAADAGKVPVVNADGTGYELGDAPISLDDTLTQVGKAADAKAAGDAIDAISPDDTQASSTAPWSGAKVQSELDAMSQEQLEKTIDAYYAMRRTGKVYQTKLYKFASNPTSAGEKLLDNAGLIFEPSTDTTVGQDDYADIPMFQWVHCNYVRDDDGAARPIAIEGMDAYKTSGAVDVGAMQMSFWWNWDASATDYVLVTVSDLPHPELGLVPWPECVKADGTILPWCIGSSYISGTASDGLLRSQPGLLPELFQSHNNLITNYQAKGAGYWGAGIARNMWQILWIAIKGATKNSQTIFSGCVSYNYQYQIATTATQQTHVTLTADQVAHIVVGSTVSIGTGPTGDETNIDRNLAYMRDIVPLATVSHIDGNDVYLSTQPFDAAQGAYISTMPWSAGSTDAVRGRYDGAIVSNTSNLYPYRIQGREYGIGAYVLASDCVADLMAGNTRNVYYAPRGASHVSAVDTIRDTYTLIGTIPAYHDGTATDWYIGDIDVTPTSGVWHPSVEGSSTSTGVGDRYYAGGDATNTQREWLQGGRLWYGSLAGSACLYLGLWLGNAWWYSAAGD